MRITELKYTERKNLGNYEHAELTASAVLEEGEDVNTAMLALKTYVNASIKGEIVKLQETTHEQPKETSLPENANGSGDREVQGVEASEPDSIPASEPKPKKPRKPKVVEEEVKEEVKEEPKKVKSAFVPYDSTIPEHKQIFGGYLAKKYGNAWKPAPSDANRINEVKAFTASLNGKDFIDSEGSIVDSFAEMVHAFFG